MTRAKIITELGEEIQCARCRQFWPADLEFFFHSNGKPHAWCKACYVSDPKTIEKRKRAESVRSTQRRCRHALPNEQLAPSVPTFNAAPLYNALFGSMQKAHGHTSPGTHHGASFI